MRYAGGCGPGARSFYRHDIDGVWLRHALGNQVFITPIQPKMVECLAFPLPNPSACSSVAGRLALAPYPGAIHFWQRCRHMWFPRPVSSRTALQTGRTPIPFSLRAEYGGGD